MRLAHARRVDRNLDEIAKAFEAMGCSVHRTNGTWDLTIGYGGMTALVEVKDGEKPPSKQKLTEAEQKFWNTWTGGVYLVRNTDDARNLLRTMTKNLNYIRTGIALESL